MSPKSLRALVAASLCVSCLAAAPGEAQAQSARTPYPAMAALGDYLISDRNTEIALARSAAPESISRDADVLILGSHGYESAVKGTNGFVCLVQRSWTAGIEDPDFWNPKLRAPICFNPAGARSFVPLTMKKTELVIAGVSKEQMASGIGAAFARKELPTIEAGAMCYMLSKQGYLNDRDGHWHPHLMFFVPRTDARSWGADLPGSPVLAADDPLDRLTVFLVPVARWSDGSADTADAH
jgi:hypothetical protein